MTYIVLMGLIMVALTALIYYGGIHVIREDDQVVDHKHM